MTDAEAVLLARCAELEARLHRADVRYYRLRRSRDHWRDLAKDRWPDAKAWRERQARAERIAGGPE